MDLRTFVVDIQTFLVFLTFILIMKEQKGGVLFRVLRDEIQS